MKIRDILVDIHALEEDLMVFERKYGVRLVMIFWLVLTMWLKENDIRWQFQHEITFGPKSLRFLKRNVFRFHEPTKLCWPN